MSCQMLLLAYARAASPPVGRNRPGGDVLARMRAYFIQAAVMRP